MSSSQTYPINLFFLFFFFLSLCCTLSKLHKYLSHFTLVSSFNKVFRGPGMSSSCALLGLRFFFQGKLFFQAVVKSYLLCFHMYFQPRTQIQASNSSSSHMLTLHVNFDKPSATLLHFVILYNENSHHSFQN